MADNRVVTLCIPEDLLYRLQNLTCDDLLLRSARFHVTEEVLAVSVNKTYHQLKVKKFHILKRKRFEKFKFLGNYLSYTSLVLVPFYNSALSNKSVSAYFGNFLDLEALI